MNGSRVYQCTPINALVEGIYEQKIPFAQIRQHGDFGLGTFDQLDGEMVMLDGQIYQMTADGQVKPVGDQALTPFACVTFFKPMSQDTLTGKTDYAAFLQWLLNLLPSPNIFYALRIDGVFAQVKVRSVPKQESYRPLVEVAREQPVFEFHEIEGTLAGFFTPTFMASINVPGLHLHFLSADRQHGGHLLECQPQQVQAGVQLINTLELGLPMNLDYLTCDFQRNIDQDLHEAEK
ncbi:MAG: acetolactate decarboxylase [Candidatus Contendobacter sp.]|jgi:acetolactate decarboxylase|nr:acetolactate decarboxylase [Gammaproteobacteria bacterium]MCC8992918.1 acetolactate decarboxylase [Candidatus Contendobacter sp.]